MLSCWECCTTVQFGTVSGPCCHVRNTAQQCRLVLFQDSDFAGDLEDSKSTSGGLLCKVRSHTFVPMSWMCKKQTSVSHISTEAEIISLDTGSRMDGIPALDLWVWLLKCSILHLTNWGNPQEEFGETSCMTHHQASTPTFKPRLQFSTMILNEAVSIMLRRTRSLLNLIRCSIFFKTTKQW